MDRIYLTKSQNMGKCFALQYVWVFEDTMPCNTSKNGQNVCLAIHLHVDKQFALK